MNYFNFKRRSLFSGPHLLGFLFIAVGIFSIVSPAIFANDTSFERALVVGAVAAIFGAMIASTAQPSFTYP
ncbi:hypothetical protein [Pontibacter sp. SGAir0037]|uniref:hypothetical protein n=1 Tax=Pontibacter sp. SGAir0037 TaxID=2571030 RepID=UPI0010CCC736|nr:hypothetical protein [Pontibacter sp. SGAir0037]QCR21634.1 hypothetical protein C1N53_04250 [Pontibacter sp. SGAir0037]